MNEKEMSFAQLCEHKKTFDKILESKCAIYCSLNKCQNPFDNEITDIYMGGDYIQIDYKEYSHGSYSCLELKIPKIFFDEDGMKSEERKAILKEAEILEIRNKISEISMMKHKQESAVTYMKRDQVDFIRLQGAYEIETSDKYLSMLLRIKDTEKEITSLDNEIKKLEKEIQVIKEG